MEPIGNVLSLHQYVPPDLAVSPHLRTRDAGVILEQTIEIPSRFQCSWDIMPYSS